jgi:hypothetical protein
MAKDEQKVSELAYSIWDQEGRPEGENERHWRMAQKAVATLSLAEAATVMNADNPRLASGMADEQHTRRER